VGILCLSRLAHLTLTLVNASMVGSGTKVYGMQDNLIWRLLL